MAYGGADKMALAEVGTIMGNRYRINSQLGSGGMGVVYHATDRFTGTDVALKQVLFDAPDSFKIDDTTIDYRLALAHEFRTMASLRHPHIISVLDYGFDDDNQPYYTMELLLDAQPLTRITQSHDLLEQVHYMVQLLQALAYLHRRGVFHRDLKPDNVIVDQGGVLRVLDFGLALVRNQKDPAQNVTGTLAYMAPETLQGLPPTPATDLYAVGVMGYEIFVGRHPFNLLDVTILIQDIVSTLPTFEGADIGADIMMILEKLMLKDPEDRYQKASDVIEALSKVADEPIPHETHAIRESFLQSAEFIGRELELDQLTERLVQAIDGHGQAILLGGESGVGKSRLLEELRISSLVRGADVTRGQGITEGGSPYALWRDTLRWLAMINPITDLEASVLKPLIPDIANLIGREVEDAPELSPQAMQARIISLMESLFERHPKDQPLVVVLEDFHWAGSESLKALEHLATHIEDAPVLIIASYRDDEYPTLPDALNLPVITVKRLTNDEIMALSTSMLGDAGQQNQVVDLLQRETDGNIFFVIEIVRTLAEESGSFDSIGKRTIPGTVFDGGLQTILKRRLEQVPTQMRQLIQLSAITGRQIDLKLAETLNQQLPNLQRVDLDDWLETLSDAAIINVVDNEWQFAHDKLREGLSADLSPSDLRDYHRRVAEAIATVYGDEPEYTIVLAYHWRRAGDTNKELLYVTRAGDQTLANGAYEEAIDFLQRALNIAGKSKLTPLTRAALLRKLSAAYVAMGNLSEGDAVLREALALYGYPAPQKTEINRKLLGQLGTQIVHRMLPFVFMERQVNRHDELVESAAAHEQLVELAYYTNDSMMGLYASLATMNISELTKPSKHLGRAYGAVSYVSMLVSNRVADAYYRKGLKAAYAVNDPLSIARTHQISALRFVSRGQWTQAEIELEKSLKIYEDLGDLRFWTSGAQTLGEVYYYRGELQRSIDIRKRVYNAAHRYGDIQAQGFGLRGQAMNLLILGELDDAEQFTQAAISRYSASNDQIGEADSWGLLALVNLRQERYRRALVNAEQVISLTTDRPPTSYNLLLGYYATAETLLTLYERDTGEDRQKLTDLIEPLLKTFRLFQENNSS
jgi:eukaryotic-like serine/threonine-protein kinase